MKRPLFATLLTFVAIIGIFGGGPLHLFAQVAHANPTDYTQAAQSSYNFIMIEIMSLFAWLVGVASITLDYATYYTVVQMGSYVHSLSAIGVTWSVLRDLGNIMLIFGFLAAGIMTILNTDYFGFSKKMIPMLLIAAVFINFSLFISEAIVDAGNLFATEFYTQINGGTLPKISPSGALLSSDGKTPLTTSNEGISNKIMAQLGLQTVYGVVLTDPSQAQQLFSGANPWLVGFMGVLLFLMAAFVMFSLALILIARFVAIVFLLVVAPVGFAGLAIPGMQRRASQWWSTLAEQTITAPILLLVLYIALKIITDVHFLTGFGLSGSQDASAATGFVGNMNLVGFGSFIMSFLVAMGLLFAVVIYSKRWSAFGADWATKLAGKATFGLTAWGLTRTAGRAAHYTARGLRQSERFNAIDAETGRLMSRALDRGAAATFDFRNAGLMKNMPFGAAVQPGEAAKGGFEGAIKRTAETQTAAVKKIGEAYKERGETAEEKEIREKAEVTHKAAEKEHAEAQKARDEAQKTTEKHQKDVEELRKQVTEDHNKGILGGEAANNLAAAEKKLAESQQNLSQAEETLEERKDALGLAEYNKNAANRKEQEKRAKEAFAKGLAESDPLISFLFHGPGKAQAVRKIRDSLKDSSTEKKALEAVKRLVEEEKKEKPGEGEGEKKEGGEEKA